MFQKLGGDHQRPEKPDVKIQEETLDKSWQVFFYPVLI